MKKESLKTNHYHHLTSGERIRISEMLYKGESIRTIANVLGKSTSTISREIKKHSVTIPTKKNDCLSRNNCSRTGVCKKATCSRKICRRCLVSCKKYCTDYVQSYCEKLMKPPYVCNGCNSEKTCSYEHTYYKPEQAEKEYRQMLMDKRNGFDMSAEMFERVNLLASPLLQKGQSPYHVKQVLGDSLPISESTLRRLVDKCELDVRNIDLRDKVKRKERKASHRKMRNEVATAAKIGHKYSDYLSYISKHDVLTVQMDCVEGTKEDSAVLLTLHFTQFHMQLAYIMDEHTTACVVKTLDTIEEAIGTQLFKEILPLILTDNGHEFMDIAGMERSINGGTRTKIFFCEPNRSDEKGACENNHKLIRYVIPKGTSIQNLRQEQVNLMMNHINSYTRKALFGKSPYELAMQILPDDFFVLLGLEKIQPNDILLKPSLLSK